MHLDLLVDRQEEGHMHEQRFDAMLLREPKRVVVHIVAYKPTGIVGRHHIVAYLPERLGQFIHWQGSLVGYEKGD